MTAPLEIFFGVESANFFQRFAHTFAEIKNAKDLIGKFHPSHHASLGGLGKLEQILRENVAPRRWSTESWVAKRRLEATGMVNCLMAWVGRQ